MATVAIAASAFGVYWWYKKNHVHRRSQNGVLQDGTSVSTTEDSKRSIVQSTTPYVLPSLSKYLSSASSSSQESYAGIYYAQSQGGRKSQEDRFCMSLLTEGVYLVGVCDGHGGGLAADYTAYALPGILRDKGDFSSAKNAAGSVADALGLIQKKFKEECGVLKRAGTTVAIAIITPRWYVTAHIGDSRIYHVNTKKSAIQQLTQDHNYKNPEETERIARIVEQYKDKYGISRMRNGSYVVAESEVSEDYDVLAMTRHLGWHDPQSAECGVGIMESISLIISVPDIQRYSIASSDALRFVLMTDGVFNHYGQERLDDLLLRSPASGIPFALCEQGDSARDNMTAVVVEMAELFGSTSTL